MPITLRVITPDKTIWDNPVQEAILPSMSGQLGVLTGHAPLLTALDIGVMRIRPDKQWKNIVVMGGFAEVENDEIKVLVNEAELADKIDIEEARIAFNEAQSALDEATRSGERKQQLRATKALKRARARFQAAGGLISS